MSHSKMLTTRRRKKTNKRQLELKTKRAKKARNAGQPAAKTA